MVQTKNGLKVARIPQLDLSAKDEFNQPGEQPLGDAKTVIRRDPNQIAIKRGA